MRTTAVTTIVLLLAGLGATDAVARRTPAPLPQHASPAPPVTIGHARQPGPGGAFTSEVSTAALNDVVRRSCARCHNNSVRRGNLSLDDFDVGAAAKSPEASEKVIAKLQLGMMPPPGSTKPGGDTLAALLTTLEQQMDAEARARPNPGRRTFQRLNRAEYAAAIHDILGLDVDAGLWLPPDTKSENFDNIADVQSLSPTLLDGYLRAAGAISRLVIGDATATASEATYSVPRTASQTAHVEGAPIGTRGGLSVIHTFPADGLYAFRTLFFHETTGAFAGGLARGERIEISIDGVRVAVLDMDRWMTASDPNGVSLATDPVRVTAGPHRVSAAFIPPASQDVAEDLISPLRWSLASTSNATAYGFSSVPHLRDLVIAGPHGTTGVSDTPLRRRVFTCTATSGASGRECARGIVARLATRAYRRTLDSRDIDPLLAIYDRAAADAGFEVGVRTALEAILASPDFVFRFERAEAAAASATAAPAMRIRDSDLASRLAFFIWSAPPDSTLVALAARGRLSTPAVLEEQVRRMLRDPRAATLSTRFVSQWLRLSDLDKVQPDVRQYPDFDEQLRTAMRRETEVFVEDIVRNDRSVSALFDADYTFVNDRLAAHYGIPGVAGPAFRRVALTDPDRRGVLAHASILTLTSQATRTSAVERGKWVMEVMLASPPPPPPPGVPDLEATADNEDGRLLTVRERMELHRKSPNCQSCHKMMDPIGLALEHYDVTGRRRLRDNGMQIDSRGELWDGRPVSTAAELRTAFERYRETLYRTFAQNLFAYGTGRRVEAFDMASIRTIVRNAASRHHAMSAYVLGVVNSPAFRQQAAESAAEPSR